MFRTLLLGVLTALALSAGPAAAQVDDGQDYWEQRRQLYLAWRQRQRELGEGYRDWMRARREGAGEFRQEQWMRYRPYYQPNYAPFRFQRNPFYRPPDGPRWRPRGSGGP
jgi:hypothetical protein